MEEDDIDEFKLHIGELVESYPNQRFSDGNVNSYFRKLAKYDMHVVLGVLAQANDRFPERMPTAGQLVQLCRAVSSDAVAETKRYLKRTFGEHYYEKDYEDGTRVGINRPVREVLVDEVSRGWTDASVLTRYDSRHPSGGDYDFGPPPGKAKVHKTPRCKALEEAWAGEAKGVELTKEENARRLDLLMKAFSEDAQEIRERKFLARHPRDRH